MWVRLVLLIASAVLACVVLVGMVLLDSAVRVRPLLLYTSVSLVGTVLVGVVLVDSLVRVRLALLNASVVLVGMPLVGEGSPHRDRAITIPSVHARTLSSSASAGRPLGVMEGLSRIDPQPPAECAALWHVPLTGLLALVRLKKGSIRPSCERVTVSAPSASTMHVTSYGRDVSIP